MSFEEKTIEEDGTKYHLKLLTLKNANMAFFYNGDMQLGTLAISMPKSVDDIPMTSSVLIGGKYMIASRFLAEKIAAKTNKMSLVSVFTTLPEKDALRTFAKILDKNLK